MRVGFQIYYADGSVFNGATQNDWIAAPDTGVLVVVEVHDAIYKSGPRQRHACRRWAGLDYYWWTPGNAEISGGNAGQIPNPALSKAGQLVDDETWCRVYNIAHQDPLYVCIN